MIKSNDHVSACRQDELLRRLKQCVGSLETKSKERQLSNISNRVVNNISPLQQRKDQRNALNMLGGRTSLLPKQNWTDKKPYIMQPDYRNSTKSKQNSTDVLELTKNYLQNAQQGTKSYQTQRKKSLNLVDTSKLTSVRKQLFIRQSTQRKSSSTVKDVSQLTKNRIAERESLINGESENSDKISYHIAKTIPSNTNSEDQFLQRLSLRKAVYFNQANPQFEKNSIRQKGIYQQSQQLPKTLETTKNYSIELKRKEIQNPSQIPSQKYQNYSKTTMENLIRDSDLRKAQKMQKLKKITDMNEEINKKIRRIVDTFQNYLTHRESS